VTSLEVCTLIIANVKLQSPFIVGLYILMVVHLSWSYQHQLYLVSYEDKSESVNAS
jgi:hypothetical protein